MRVSIIVPTYNEEKHIEQTLQLARAAAPDAEIIVADGHSADKTLELAKPFADSIVFEKGNTIASGRNAGAEAAQGELLWFLDADTRASKEFNDAMRKAFDDPSVVGVGCAIMPEDLSLFERLFFRGLNFMNYASVKLGRPCIAGSCVAYRKTAFNAIKGFDEERVAAEDFDLCTRITSQGKVVWLDRVTVYTSNRRLRSLGLFGLIKDWSRTTLEFLQGKKSKKYDLFHDKQ